MRPVKSVLFISLGLILAFMLICWAPSAQAKQNKRTYGSQLESPLEVFGNKRMSRARSINYGHQPARARVGSLASSARSMKHNQHSNVPARTQRLRSNHRQLPAANKKLSKRALSRQKRGLLDPLVGKITGDDCKCPQVSPELKQKLDALQADLDRQQGKIVAVEPKEKEAGVSLNIGEDPSEKSKVLSGERTRPKASQEELEASVELGPKIEVLGETKKIEPEGDILGEPRPPVTGAVQVGSIIEDKVSNKIADKLDPLALGAGGLIDHSVKAAANILDPILEKEKQIVENVAGKIKDLKEDIVEIKDNIKDRIKDNIIGLKESVKDKIEGVEEAIEEKIDPVVEIKEKGLKEKIVEKVEEKVEEETIEEFEPELEEPVKIIPEIPRRKQVRPQAQLNYNYNAPNYGYKQPYYPPAIYSPAYNRKPANQIAPIQKQQPLYQTPISVESTLAPRCRTKVFDLVGVMRNLLFKVESLTQRFLGGLGYISYMTKDIISRQLARIRNLIGAAIRAANSGNLIKLNEVVRRIIREIITLDGNELILKLEPGLFATNQQIRRVYSNYRRACKSVD